MTHQYCMTRTAEILLRTNSIIAKKSVIILVILVRIFLQLSHLQKRCWIISLVLFVNRWVVFHCKSVMQYFLLIKILLITIFVTITYCNSNTIWFISNSLIIDIYACTVNSISQQENSNTINSYWQMHVRYT